GNDTLTITVNDQMYIGAGEAKSDTKKVNLSVISVPDSPELVLPAGPSVKEDGVLSIQGMSIYDADATMEGDEDLLFTTRLHVTAGRLSLNNTLGLNFTRGRGWLDHSLSFTGTLDSINIAVGDIKYVPDHDFNSMQHVEVFTAAVWQVASEEAEVVKGLPVFVGAVNDQPKIIVPRHHVVKMAAFNLLDQHSTLQERSKWLT
ncbi:unnamed protein product, partial [Choristocarpus tenellus]